jgi:ribosomal protein L32
MVKYGYEPDAFDPVEVEKGRKERQKREGDTFTPYGGNRYCPSCRGVLGAKAIPGTVCPYCGINT